MKPDLSLEELLHWRLLQSMEEAPPAPRASRLLDLARPWWEVWPEKFQAMGARLSGLSVSYGHALVDPDTRGGGIPVSTVIWIDEVETDALATLLYFNARAAKLRLRFQLAAPLASLTPNASTFDRVEVTFVSTATSRPLFTAPATLSPGHEYRLDVPLPEELKAEWATLKVTDRMPFLFIIRARSS